MGANLEGNIKLPNDDEILKCINMSFQNDKIVPGQISIDGEFILMNL